MNRYSVIIFLSFFCNAVFAQERDLVKEMTGNYIQIRQRPNTECLLREWLDGITLNEDTVYAVLYVPMDCPRCEAAIPNFWERLKEVDPHQKMLLITAYPDSLLAQDYVHRNDYQADAYLYDTTEHYKQIFDTNMAGGLMGLHIMKIDRRSGNLLTGGQYTVLGNMFVKQLIGYKGMLEKATFPAETTANDDSIYTTVPKNIPPLKHYHDYLIDTSARVSTIFDVPRFIGKSLFFTDVLQNGVMVFTQENNGMKYNGTLRVDSTEKNRFIGVPEKVYQSYVRHKMLFYIALGTNLIDENHIGISYSIPKAVQDGDENSYGLYNAPVIISRDIDTMAPDSMLSLNFDLENDTVFFNTHFSFTRYKDNIFIGCKKLTWPMDFEREDYENIPSKNPFYQEFYEESTPFVAAFSIEDGNLHKRYGQLDISQAVSRTGYYFTKPIAASFGDEFLYTDGYSGKIFIASDNGNTEQCYQAFTIDTLSLPRPDSTLFYSFDYVKPYTKFFNRCITDVRFDKKRIYSIVKFARPDSDEGARYVYTVIDRKTGKAKEYAIPQSPETVLGCGLRLENRKVYPFAILKDSELTKVRVFTGT